MLPPGTCRKLGPLAGLTAAAVLLALVFWVTPSTDGEVISLTKLGMLYARLHPGMSLRQVEEAAGPFYIAADTDYPGVVLGQFSLAESHRRVRALLPRGREFDGTIAVVHDVKHSGYNADLIHLTFRRGTLVKKAFCRD